MAKSKNNIKPAARTPAATTRTKAPAATTTRAPRTKTEQRAITTQAAGLAGLLGTPNYTGLPVTEQTSLGLAAVSCALRVISEAVGSLPPKLYKCSESRTIHQPQHPLTKVLRFPNDEVTRPVLWESFVATGLLYGNGFLEIVREEGSGRPIELWNIHPQHVLVQRDSATAKLKYFVTNSMTGGPAGEPGSQKPLDSYDIIHVPFNITQDGSVGYKLLTIARDTIGFGLAAQRYGCSLFRNLGRPGGVITIPQTTKLNAAGYENIRKGFTSDHSGENVGSVLLLENGISFEPLNLATNEQIQYKELLQYFNYTVAQLFNIPPFKLHSLETATWNNATQQNEAFLSTTLRPLLEKIECELEKKLLMPSEQLDYEIEYDTHELLRADKKTRYETYKTALNNTPFLTINEIRAEEGYPPILGGDELPKPPAPAVPPAAEEPVTDTAAEEPVTPPADKTPAAEGE